MAISNCSFLPSSKDSSRFSIRVLFTKLGALRSNKSYKKLQMQAEQETTLLKQLKNK